MLFNVTQQQPIKGRDDGVKEQAHSTIWNKPLTVFTLDPARRVKGGSDLARAVKGRSTASVNGIRTQHKMLDLAFWI